jgi:putative membrane protein
MIATLDALGSLRLHTGDWSAWQPHPDVWLLVFGLGGLYLLALEYLGPRYVSPGERPASRRQIACFAGGLFVLWLGSDWPIHNLAEGYLYSVHMVQHMLYSLIAPPLLLMGLPPWMLRWLLRPAWLKAAVGIVTRPIVALVFFNAVVVLTHLPAVVNLTLESHLAHFGAHVLIIASALSLWWPVVGPLPEMPKLSLPASCLYLFAQSIVPTVPASFLTFSGSVIYDYYETVPRLGGLSVVEDQRIAALIMKVVGGLYLWAIITVLFFKWYEEDGAEETDDLKWHEVEEELDRLGVRNQ